MGVQCHVINYGPTARSQDSRAPPFTYVRTDAFHLQVGVPGRGWVVEGYGYRRWHPWMLKLLVYLSGEPGVVISIPFKTSHVFCDFTILEVGSWQIFGWIRLARAGKLCLESWSLDWNGTNGTITWAMITSKVSNFREEVYFIFRLVCVLDCFSMFNQYSLYTYMIIYTWHME